MQRKEVSLEQAVDLCTSNTAEPGEEIIKVTNAFSRVCSQDIRSLVDVPTSKRSRVDGYAIGPEDLYHINHKRHYLKLVGKIKAGSLLDTCLSPGQTIKVMTGAFLPPGTGAVIKQEDITTDGDCIIARKAVGAGENIQAAASVIKKGELLAGQGQMLYARDLEIISSAGWADIQVYSLPKVYVANSGSELTLPGRALPPGCIFNSNRSLLLGKLAKASCQLVTGSGELQDDLTVICREIDSAASQSDVVIITGGASDGDYDLVAPALEKLDAQLLFTRIDIKPGSNTTVAIKEGTVILNLPGSPGAVDTLFEVLVYPLLKKAGGAKDYLNRWIPIRLCQPVDRLAARRMLMRGELVEKNAAWMARPLAKGQKGTGIKPLILDLGPGQGNQGDVIKVLIVDGE